MALRSGSYDINALAGQTLRIDFELFEDNERTMPFPLTGCSVSAVLRPPTFGPDDAITLTDGHGLTVDYVGGVVTLVQSAAGWQVGRGRWYMEIVDQFGEPSYPVRGILFVGNP